MPEGRRLEPAALQRRAGPAPAQAGRERGEGQWEEISWDQAHREIADAILDAVEDQGAESLYHIGTPGEGGMQQIMWNAFSAQLGFQVTDLHFFI